MPALVGDGLQVVDHPDRSTLFWSMLTEASDHTDRGAVSMVSMVSSFASERVGLTLTNTLRFSDRPTSDDCLEAVDHLEDLALD